MPLCLKRYIVKQNRRKVFPQQATFDIWNNIKLVLNYQKIKLPLVFNILPVAHICQYSVNNVFTRLSYSIWGRILCYGWQRAEGPGQSILSLKILTSNELLKYVKRKRSGFPSEPLSCIFGCL